VPKNGNLPPLNHATPSWSPAVSGAVSGLIYAAVFAGLPRLVHGSSEDLFWLSGWGGCYFGFAVAMARSASSEVFHIIQNRVLPLLSPEAVVAIDGDLENRFGRSRIQIVFWGSALVAALISAIAIRQDVFPTSRLLKKCFREGSGV
jgi:hypothetical protein